MDIKINKFIHLTLDLISNKYYLYFNNLFHNFEHINHLIKQN